MTEQQRRRPARGAKPHPRAGRSGKRVDVVALGQQFVIDMLHVPAGTALQRPPPYLLDRLAPHAPGRIDDQDSGWVEEDGAV